LASLGHLCRFQRVSRLGSVTAQHSSSGRQPNFAAFHRGHHLYSAGRPSLWSLVYISSLEISFFDGPLYAGVLRNRRTQQTIRNNFDRVSKASCIIRAINEKNGRREINGQCYRKQVIDNEYNCAVAPSGESIVVIASAGTDGDGYTVMFVPAQGSSLRV